MSSPICELYVGGLQYNCMIVFVISVRPLGQEQIASLNILALYPVWQEKGRKKTQSKFTLLCNESYIIYGLNNG